MLLVRTYHASRRYGQVLALHDISLVIPAGGVVGLLGPNGAGKTTLINLMIGHNRPSSGTVELFGGDPRDPAQRREIGVTLQDSGLPATLRVRECVDFVAAHFPAPVARDELLDRFGLLPLAGRQTAKLSGGEKRRLAVALAFVGRPRLAFLDEPTTGLDVQSRRSLWDAIRAFVDEGGTVVLTSHYLEEVEALADRVVVLGHGRVLTDGTVDEVRSRVSVHRVSFESARPVEFTDVVSTERSGDRTTVLTNDPDGFVRELVRSGVPYTGLEVQATTLEEAFLAITASEDPGVVAHAGAHPLPDPGDSPDPDRAAE